VVQQKTVNYPSCEVHSLCDSCVAFFSKRLKSKKQTVISSYMYMYKVHGLCASHATVFLDLKIWSGYSPEKQSDIIHLYSTKFGQNKINVRQPVRNLMALFVLCFSTSPCMFVLILLLVLFYIFFINKQ